MFIPSSVLQTYSVTDAQCSTVLLSYTVLQTDSGVAQAAVAKAGGDRGVVLCCCHDYRGCSLDGTGDRCGDTAASSSL